jgi:hydrogenase maturation protease
MTGAAMTGPAMTGRTLVAGVGNVFLRDDGFGVEVVRLLATRPQRPGVEVRDYGIRGVHLVYDLLDGCDLFVLVDAAERGEPPGTVTVLEAELPEGQSLIRPVIDAHSLAPDDIFALLASLGGRPGRSVIVACQPADIGAGMGLSEPVREAVPHAVRAVEEILAAAGGSGAVAPQEAVEPLCMSSAWPRACSTRCGSARPDAG